MKSLLYYGRSTLVAVLGMVLIAILGAAHSAVAASIAFRTSGIPNSVTGRVQLLIYFEDHSRELPLNGIQFDIDLTQGARLATVYPNTYGPANSNSSLEDPTGNSLLQFPFDLTATTGYSPSPPNDNLLVAASRFPFNVSDYAATLDSFSGGTCIPEVTCALQREAAEQDRVLLGRFDVFWDRFIDPSLGPGFFVVVNHLNGNTPETIDALQAQTGQQIFVPVATPEPAEFVMITALLALLGVVRWSSSQVISAVQRQASGG